YVAILPDSFSTRRFPEGVCAQPDEVTPQLRRIAPLQRAYDAYAALAYLRGLGYVDGVHVGVMGGSHGGSSTLASMVMPASNRALSGRDQGLSRRAALVRQQRAHALSTQSPQRQFRHRARRYHRRRPRRLGRRDQGSDGLLRERTEGVVRPSTRSLTRARSG